MNCLRCGKETQNEQVFCDSCLEDMEKYPVKPGTAVQLPSRQAAESAKKQTSRKRSQKPEEQFLQMRKLIRWLTVIIAALSLLLCITAGMLAYLLSNQQPSRPAGRNYTTDVTDQP